MSRLNLIRLFAVFVLFAMTGCNTFGETPPPGDFDGDAGSVGESDGGDLDGGDLDGGELDGGDLDGGDLDGGDLDGSDSDMGAATNWSVDSETSLPTLDSPTDWGLCPGTVNVLPNPGPESNLGVERIVTQTGELFGVVAMNDRDQIVVRTVRVGASESTDLFESAVLYRDDSSAVVDSMAVGEQLMVAGVNQAGTVDLVQCSFAGEPACRVTGTGLEATNVALGFFRGSFQLFTLERVDDTTGELVVYRVDLAPDLTVVDGATIHTYPNPDLAGETYIEFGYIGSSLPVAAVLVSDIESTRSYSFATFDPSGWEFGGTPTDASPYSGAPPDVAFLTSSSRVWGSLGPTLANGAEQVDVYQQSGGAWSTAPMRLDAVAFDLTPIEGGDLELFVEPTRLKIVRLPVTPGDYVVDLTNPPVTAPPVRLAVADGVPAYAYLTASGIILQQLCRDP